MLQERPTNLALISIEREYFTVDVKNEIVPSDRRVHLGKRN